jgi:mono/diheme cytochrome c family protein
LSIRIPLIATVAVASLAFFPLVGFSQQAEEKQRPDLSEETLGKPETIAHGRELFQDQCTLCHGRTAYPGKAPLLRPSRYTADFVYDRVAFGFRDMPPWEDMFPEEDLVAIVAYIMSDRFAH